MENEYLTDILYRHFSLKGKSGGGDFQVFQISSNMFSVLFKSEQVRDQVLARSQKIITAGSEVAVTVNPSLPENTAHNEKVHNRMLPTNKEKINIASCCTKQIQIPTEAVYSSLLEPHFLKSLRDECTNVQFQFDKTTLMLQIKGTPESVSSTKSEVHAALKRLKCKEINIPPAVITYLRSKGSEEVSRMLFLSPEVFATIDMPSDNHVVIYGLSHYDIKRAEKILMEDITLQEVLIHEEDACVVHTERFETFIEELNKLDNGVQVSIVKSVDTNDMTPVCILAGRKTELCLVEKKIKEFIKEHSKVTVNMILDGGMELTESLPQLLGHLDLDHLTESITWNPDTRSLELTGTQKETDEATTAIKEKTKGLLSKTVTICRPGAYSYFKADGQEFLRSLHSMLSCMAVLNAEPGAVDLQVMSVIKRNATSKGSGIRFEENDTKVFLIANNEILFATVSDKISELSDMIITPLCRSTTGSTVLNAAGPKVKTELAKTVQRNALTLTGPGNLPCRLLAHVPCLCGSRAKEYLRDSIKECQKRKFKSITVFLDLNELHESFDKYLLAEDLIITAFRNMDAEEGMIIELAQREFFQVFKNAAKSVYDAFYSMNTTGLLFFHATPIGILGCLRKTSESKNDPESLHRHSSLCEPAVLHLFSKQPQLLDKAKDAVERHYAGFLSTDTLVWLHSRICDKRVLSQIYKLQEKHNVNVIVDNGVVLFNGLSVKTSIAREEAFELLKQVEALIELEQKEKVFKNIQWGINNEEQGDVRLSCEDSYEVEVQYMCLQEAITVTHDNKAFITINVKDMTAINKETSQVYSVQRKELMLENFPGKWCMTKEENFKKVKLDIASLEYVSVERRFNETFSSKLIKKIERIENRSLWKRFTTDLSGEVKRLFYGLSHVDVQQVEKNGFFRPPETFFSSEHSQGRGIYFYVDASSARRCEEDAKGHKVMFLGRVQTGKFTTGRKGINAPPRVDPSDPGVLYHSVVDNMDTPSIFVIFSSDRAYPEYLITFSDRC